MSALRIGYAGMTHLGLVSAIAAAERGFSVSCFDLDAARIAMLRRGELPVIEPDLPALRARNEARLHFTDRADDLATCDVVYVASDIATDDAGASDLTPIIALIDIVDPVLSATAIMVILSQVPPGFTRRLAWEPGRRFYQVETLIFGRAVERALRPERFIVGCAEPETALPESLRCFLAAFDCPILPMRYESAELTKISINMCLVASIGVANTLAEICERIGADWREMLPALKLDRRIGQYAYLAPGLGIAGGNLERDLATICGLADRFGTDAGIVRAWTRNIRHRRDWVLRQLHDRVLQGRSEAMVAILGLAYKEDTHSTKNSPALALLKAIGSFEVTVFDPVVRARSEFHPRLATAATALDACQDADAMVIMTPWAEFRALDPQAVRERMRGRIVIDPFGLLDEGKAVAAGLDYVTIGVAARAQNR
jgi:UDPglucose 6-dehydrogenase